MRAPPRTRANWLHSIVASATHSLTHSLFVTPSLALLLPPAGGFSRAPTLTQARRPGSTLADTSTGTTATCPTSTEIGARTGTQTAGGNEPSKAPASSSHPPFFFNIRRLHLLVRHQRLSETKKKTHDQQTSPAWFHLDLLQGTRTF